MELHKNHARRLEGGGERKREREGGRGREGGGGRERGGRERETLKFRQPKPARCQSEILTGHVVDNSRVLIGWHVGLQIM